MTSTPTTTTDDLVTEPALDDPAAEPLREGTRSRAPVGAVRQRAEAGMSTAEYAVGTVAACAFAAVLYRVVTGGLDRRPA